MHGQWVLLGLNWLSGLGLTTFPLGEQVTLNGSQSIFGRSELWLQLQSRLVPAHGFLKLLLVTRKAKTLDVVHCLINVLTLCCSTASTYDTGEQLSVNIDGLLEKKCDCGCYHCYIDIGKGKVVHDEVRSNFYCHASHCKRVLP